MLRGGGVGQWQAAFIALGRKWTCPSSLGRFGVGRWVELEGKVRLTSVPLYRVRSDAAGTVAAREVPRSWSIAMR